MSNRFGYCNVVSEIERLLETDEELWWKVGAPFYEMVPHYGPDACETRELTGGVHEFCFGGLPGAAFRILWFEGSSPNEIVCSKRGVVASKIWKVRLCKAQRESGAALEVFGKSLGIGGAGFSKYFGVISVSDLTRPKPARGQ